MGETGQGFPFDISRKQDTLLATDQFSDDRQVVQRLALCGDRRLRPGLRIEHHHAAGRPFGNQSAFRRHRGFELPLHHRSLDPAPEFFLPLRPVGPEFLYLKMSQDPGQPSDVIQLRVCPDDMIDASNPSIPQKRRHHTPPHVKPLIGRTSIDQRDRPIGQFNDRTITLPHVEEGHAHHLLTTEGTWRPKPPEQDTSKARGHGPSEQRRSMGRPPRQQRPPQHIEQQHHGNRRCGHEPFRARQTGQHMCRSNQPLPQRIDERSARERAAVRHNHPDGRQQTSRQEDETDEGHHEKIRE